MIPRSAFTLLVGLTLALATASARAADSDAVCNPGGTTTVAVALKAPAEQHLAGVRVTLDYPEKAVRIPGFENRPEVQRRISKIPPGFFIAPNDTDKELIVSLAGTTALPEGTIFAVEFDHCAGAPVTAREFHCTVDQASNEQAHLVDGATCAATIAHDTTGGTP